MTIPTLTDRLHIITNKLTLMHASLLAAGHKDVIAQDLLPALAREAADALEQTYWTTNAIEEAAIGSTPAPTDDDAAEMDTAGAR